ncbi:MAG TPA: beta-N-acetylhexosaminidase [Candidatus Nanopelagicaceae bacterium]|nr:beta-N-acetylhexosaminidase [Candidatus Nanopelagicaceae bacterium]
MIEEELKIIPEPAKVSLNDGVFILSQKTTIQVDLTSTRNGEYLKQVITSKYGLNLAIEKSSQNNEGKNSIKLKTSNEKNLNNSEKYYLLVSRENIIISATTSIGVFYGIQTLIQLIPHKASKGDKVSLESSIPCVSIEDFPRFKWRGFMLDESRHFFGKKQVKKILDLMALLKLNTFHWHLTDDQGWRVEIKKYPLLTKIGSKREGTIISRKKLLLSSQKRKLPIDGIPVSGYYTREDLMELIEYASERYITIIPEIDFPGHTMAALAAYPELSCTGGPFEVSTRFGIHKDVFCIGKEEVFEFSQNVLDEVMDIFPSKIIHTGGDEVPRHRWNKCSECQNRIIKEGVAGSENLQVYFTNRIADYLASKGRHLMGWNEILNDKLNEDAICHYWTNNLELVLQHAMKGRKVVMSEMSAVYLNYPYKLIPTKKTYLYDPVPEEYGNNYEKHILGIEACLWTEYINSKDKLEWQTFPRLIAVAETGWTPKNKRNFESFLKRLENFIPLLKAFDVNYPKKEEFLQDQ